MGASVTEKHLVFVINSAPPYCYDFNEILAVPNGFRYRNRFDLKWVHPDLKSGVGQLVGRQVLLVLRDMANNQLVPVRWALVRTAQVVGHVAYFEYLVDDLIKYESLPDVRLAQVKGATNEFSNLHPWLPGQPNTPLADPSVFESSACSQMPRADGADLTAWGNAVAALALAPTFEGVEFLKVVDLVTADGISAPVADEGFLVSPGRVYQLKVFQDVPNPIATPVAPHSIECKSFPESVVPLRAKQQAVGKYDMLTFVLRTRSLEPGERTSLEIPHSPDASTLNVARSSIYIPLATPDVRAERQLLSLAILLTACFFVFKPGALGTTLVDSQTIRNIATVIFIVTIAGPSRALGSLWPSWPFGGSGN